MSNKFTPLFQPIKIGKVELKNRFALSPMGLVEIDEKRVWTQRSQDYYVERAKGGVGLVITGTVFAENTVEKHRPTSACASIDPVYFEKNVRQLAERIHAYGAKFFVQLSAGMGRNQVAWPNPEDNLAPSECTNWWNPKHKHRAMTTEEIYQLIENYGKAALSIKKGGADGIEIHAMHGGYLLDCFAMAMFNQRTDEFGGSLNNRLRLPMLLLKEVRKTCGDGFAVGVRVGVKSFIRGDHLSAVPGQEFVELGRDTEEGLEICKKMEEYGFDYLNIDCGCYDADMWGKPPCFMPYGTWLEYVAMVKKLVKIPVLNAGSMGEPDVALDAVVSGKTDIVALGRPLIADAHFVNKLKRNEPEDIRICVRCGEGCRKYRTKDRTPSCAFNPTAQHEKEKQLFPTVTPKKVFIIGAGPAGMEAARILKTRGHDVKIADRADYLGGLFKYASTPDFKDADKKLIQWYAYQFKKLGLEVSLNDSVDENDPRLDWADIVICATGSNAIIPPLPGIEKAVTAKEVLGNHGANVPNDVVIIGGGMVGCEQAIYLSKMGKKVKLVEMAPKLMTVGTPCNPNYQMIIQLLENYGVDVHLSTKLTEVKDDGVVCSANGEEVFIPAEKTILALGFRSENTLFNKLYRHLNKEVYNLGDSMDARNAMFAVWDAYELASTLY